jgi:GTP-binding protein
MSKKPIIAIVGRPNVGKSTLFNRLVGRRVALVSDMPGLTRDRREGEATIFGHDVTVVDTAGLEEAPRDTIPDRMRAQSETAIMTADVLLFVIDARAGVTPMDRQFGDLVRKSGRPTLLIANKVEGNKARDAAFEAYELGLGDPINVSAEHGEGLYDLDDAIGEILGPPPKKPRAAAVDEADAPQTEDGTEGEDDAEPADEPGRPIKLAIVGRPNAGKSTLVNALLGEDRMITGPEPGLTRDSISTPFDWVTQGRDGPMTRSFELFDTAGLRRKSRINKIAEKLSAGDALKSIRFAEVVVLVIDAEIPLEHQDLTIADHVIEEGRALVIAVNKWDLIGEKQKVLQDIRKSAAERLSQAPGLFIVPVSALAERGMDKLMTAVIRTYAIWNRRISTPDLNRWLEEAVARHAPPASSGRRIKIRYVTQPSARPPTFVAFASQPDGLPRSYHRYLLNSLREAFDMPAVPIRMSFRKGANPYANRAGGRK